MLKFFRRIRQNLLNEGKTSRYFKYAIGEILLVMIGILLALQVNNWNEDRKERIQELALLKQLRIEFKSNLKQLDEKVTIRREIIHAASNLLNFIDNPNARIKDSIDHDIATSIAYTTFDPVVSDMSNSGSMRLIKNDSLKQLLSFWTSEIVQVTEVEAGWRKYRDEVYVPFLIEHYQIRTARNALIKTDYLKKFQIDKNIDSYLLTIGGIGNTKYPEDYNHILNLPDFEDHLVRCIVTNNIGDVQSAILRKRIIQILEIIESEIQQ